jgi:Protein of unknown function (DUF3363)
MRKLEALGLARPLGPALWSISENAEEVLRELGERNDIIKRIHRGLTEKGWERGISDFVLHGEAEPIPVIGRLVASGLDHELKGSAYVVIDGVDGRAHHIRLPHLDVAGDSAPGSIVELRRFEDAAGRPQLAIAVRSDLAIDSQVKAQGATWLDRQLVAKEPIALSEGGFGAEVREAMSAPRRPPRGGRARPPPRPAGPLRPRPSRRRRGTARGGDWPCLPAGVWWRACRGDLPPAGNPRLRTFRHDRQRARLQPCPVVSIFGAPTHETGFGNHNARRQCRLEFWAQAGTRDLRIRRLPDR